MSLILEALRKREREKQVPERGFLVMAETPWAPTRDRSVWVVLAAAVLAFGLGAAFVSLSGPRPVAPVPIAAEASVAAPAPSPVPSPLGTLLPAVTRATPTPSVVASPPAPSPESATPSPSPSSRPLVLQAISERDGQPVALISDHLLREGDTLEGARILHIGETEVELELDGRHLTLRF